MFALSTDLLPASLASRLDDEQRQAVAEAPREKRLDVLATALGVPEPDAIALLASAAGLDIASNLEADTEARGLVPARLVHDYQIIPIRFGPPPAEGDASPAAVFSRP